MRIDVVTIFPEYLAPLELSLIGKARRSGLVELAVHDLRDFTHDRHRTVDDAPAGGGAGMVMRPEPWGEAIDHVLAAGAGERPGVVPTLLVPSPSGRRFDQAMAHELAGLDWLAFACGRYEGIDERVLESAIDEELSIGDYVLSGGELAACVVIDAIGRLADGALGNAESAVQDSFTDGLLDCPHYTRSEAFDDATVPEVLKGGDHAAIARWRRKQSLGRTWLRRPDLLAAVELSRKDQELLDEFRREHRAKPVK